MAKKYTGGGQSDSDGELYRLEGTRWVNEVNELYIRGAREMSDAIIPLEVLSDDGGISG